MEQKIAQVSIEDLTSTNLMGYLVLKEITLDEIKHQVTGHTRHFVGGEQVESTIKSLKIIQIPPGTAFYLIYFNKNGKELTDTWHQSLEDAMNQAKFEFNVRPEEWKDVLSNSIEHSTNI